MEGKKVIHTLSSSSHIQHFSIGDFYMTKKNVTITALAAVLILSMAAWAVAGPGYGRGGCGGNSMYEQLTPEKQAAVDKIVEKYSGQLSELRNQMWTKHATLQAMVNGGEADEKKIGKLTAELTDLRDKMYDTRKSMSDELVKETGITAGRGFGSCPSYGRSGCPGGGGGFGGKGFQGGKGFHGGRY